MTRLEELKARAEALPGKRAHTQLVSQLRKYGEDLTAVREGLAEVTVQRGCVEHVFPDVELAKVDGALREAARTARGLRTTLTKDLEAITTSSVEERVRKIKDAAKNARAVVKDAWHEALKKKLGALEPIVNIARDAKLAGGESMARQLDALRKQLEPPGTDQEAEDAEAGLRELTGSIATLGLKGAAGAFLQNAVQGRARADDLENAEVRELLDRYKLWDRLSIKLG
jgi:hypothetical protein